MPLDREAMYRMWPKLALPLNLLEKWDAPRGIIFESDRESAWEAANAVAEHLGGAREVFEAYPITKDDWRERVEKHTSFNGPPAALFEKRKQRLCVLIVDFDHQPEWLQLHAKAPMDRGTESPVGYCVLATADDTDQIPPNVRSHFFIVRKTGSRRGPRGE